MANKELVSASKLEEVLQGGASMVFDGAMGTALQARGLKPGELPDWMCLDDPQAVTEVHASYVEAGSDAVTTNTFGANRLRLGSPEAVEELYRAAVRCARDSGAGIVAADIGPSGEMMDPYGDLEFDEAVDIFSEQAKAAQAAGADLVIIETMTDLEETRAAVTAAKSSCSLPVFATMAFAENGFTIMGDDPASCARELEQLGADAVGINCSLGPAMIHPLAKQMVESCSVPVIVQANAGLPQVGGGQTSYDIGPEQFADEVAGMLDDGVRIVGGCCGTTPEYIKLIAGMVAGR